MKVAVDYVWLGKLENEIRSSHYTLRDIQYAEGVEIYVFVLKENEEEFIKWMTELSNGQSVTTREDAQFIEFIRE